MKATPQAGRVQAWCARLRAAWALVRLRPFDVATPEGQSQERYRRAALTALAALASKGLTMLTLLVSVPLTMGYLGAERFGDRKSTRLNSSHIPLSRMPSSA